MDPFELYTAVESRVQGLLTDIEYNLPINIKSVIEHLGIEYYERTFRSGFDGVYLLTSGGNAHIYINNHRSKSVGRRRFTAGHEVIHHLIASEMGLKEAFFMDTRENQADPVERICNKGAGMLIMPEADVRRTVNEFRIYPRAHVLQTMSLLFGVSIREAAVRLEELGLLDQITKRTRKW